VTVQEFVKIFRQKILSISMREDTITIVILEVHYGGMLDAPCQGFRRGPVRKYEMEGIRVLAL
jgi:hypothetical protein